MMRSCRNFAAAVFAGLILLVPARLCAQQTTDTYPAVLWPSEPPGDCPFEPSKSLTGVIFTGRHAQYTGADTWNLSWASDNRCYSSWVDGTVNGLTASAGGEKANSGYATVVGDDPLDLEVIDAGLMSGSPAPYGGRYPTGGLVHDGIWYYGTFCLDELAGFNWGTLGPFVGFNISKDFGKTWTPSPHTPEKPLFGESAKNGKPVKLGFLHFVDFGKNMEHSPDGKAYIVSQGADASDPKPRPGNLSWITGDQIYLCRVTPSLENMNDASKYEYYAGKDKAGADLWSKDIADLKPLLEWNNFMGCVTITYNAPLRKFLMCVTDGRTTWGQFNTYILESDSLTGTWRLVTYMRDFGAQAYSVNFPSKFILSEDGRTLWLSYSANYVNFGPGYLYVPMSARPQGSAYALCLQEVRLLAPDEAPNKVIDFYRERTLKR